MRKKSSRHRHLARLRWIATVFALGATALVAAPATAASYNGALGIKSVGTPYAGTDSFSAAVSRSVSPGSTGSFSVEVINKGTTVSQFQVNIVAYPESIATAVLDAGSTNVTALADQGYDFSRGYVTGPIQPGKTVTLTLKLTIPKTAQPADQSLEGVELSSPGGATQYEAVVADAQVAWSTSTSPTTLFATANSQSKVLGGPADVQDPWVTAATLTGTATDTYTLTVKNSSTAPAHLSLIANPLEVCGSDGFAATYKLGSTDISSAVLGSGYDFPIAFPAGASKTVTVTVKAVPAGIAAIDPTSCGYTGGFYTQLRLTGDITTSQTVVLVSNYA
jgi:hypothetical protein